MRIVVNNREVKSPAARAVAGVAVAIVLLLLLLVVILVVIPLAGIALGVAAIASLLGLGAAGYRWRNRVEEAKWREIDSRSPRRTPNELAERSDLPE